MIPTTIDTSKTSFTLADPAAQASTIIFNGGTLLVTGSNSLGQSILVLSTGGTLVTQGNPLTLYGSILDGGKLTFIGNSQIVLINTLSGGSVEIVDDQFTVDGVVTSSLTIDAAGFLRGDGLISGPTTVAGQLEPGNSPGTLTFTAPVTMLPGSALALEIDGPGTGNGAGNYSRVIVNGASFGAAGTLVPLLRGITYASNETPGTNSYSPPLGQRFAGVVQASGGLLGSFSGLTQPAGLLAGTRFDTVYTPTSLDLYVTPANYGNLAAAGLSQTRNEASLGSALDALRPAAGTLAAGDTKALFDALAPLNGNSLPATLGQLAGQIHPELPAAAVEVGRSMGDALTGRFDQLHGDALAEQAQGGLTGLAFGFSGGQARGAGGPAAGETGVAGGGGRQTPTVWSSWARGFGAFVNNSGDGNNPGFHRNTGGGVAGADRLVADDVHAGLELGYAHSDITANQGGGNAWADSYRLGAYASWTPGRLFVDGGLGGGLDRFDTRRSVALGSLGGTAEGHTTSHDADAELAIGTRLALGGFTVEPSADLRYDLAALSSTSESGAGLLGLSVAGATHQALQAGLGARVTRSFTLDDGLVLEPDLKLRWEHEVLDPGFVTRETLGGAPFSVTAARPGRDAAVAGVGLAAVLDTHLKLYVHYDADVSANQTGQAITAGLRYSW